MCDYFFGTCMISIFISFSAGTLWDHWVPLFSQLFCSVNMNMFMICLCMYSHFSRTYEHAHKYDLHHEHSSGLNMNMYPGCTGTTEHVHRTYWITPIRGYCTLNFYYTYLDTEHGTYTWSYEYVCSTVLYLWFHSNRWPPITNTSNTPCTQPCTQPAL